MRPKGGCTCHRWAGRVAARLRAGRGAGSVEDLRASTASGALRARRIGRAGSGGRSTAAGVTRARKKRPVKQRETMPGFHQDLPSNGRFLPAASHQCRSLQEANWLRCQIIGEAEMPRAYHLELLIAHAAIGQRFRLIQSLRSPLRCRLDFATSFTVMFLSARQCCGCAGSRKERPPIRRVARRRGACMNSRP